MTSWKRCRITKKVPNEATYCSATENEAEPNARFAKSFTSISRRDPLICSQMNTPASATPPNSPVSTIGSNQPRCGASMRPKTKMATATAEVTEPSQSNGVGLLSFEVGIVHDSTATRVADAAKVMKIECQLKDSNSMPVMKNPAIAPIPATP